MNIGGGLPAIDTYCKLANPDREQLDQEEDRFVAARHRCGECSACIEQSYRERIRYLEQALAGENARETLKGLCVGHVRPG
jgi:uncharacterized protein